MTPHFGGEAELSLMSSTLTTTGQKGAYLDDQAVLKLRARLLELLYSAATNTGHNSPASTGVNEILSKAWMMIDVDKKYAWRGQPIGDKNAE